MLHELIESARSVRRFDAAHAVARETLRELVALARLSASSANLQPLKFILSCTPERNERIFPRTAWAGYLQDWPGPEPSERPAAYIVILGDTGIARSFAYDAGIAAQSMILGAREMGLGACLIGSIKREELRRELAVDPRYEILLILALGRPAETIVVEDMGPEADVRYWRDADGVHHVPKRSLDELILD
jgi:nitroreductase